ncbi:MAG: transcription antitermination factor NusB [Clostridia bacterium]|nr:transcription antitermination factor NusB [Clostridia bacterium]
MKRSEAREQAFVIVFEKEFNSESTVDEIAAAAKEAELFETDKFAKRLSEAVFADIEALDKIIVENLRAGWRISRISKVALAILRMAICEMTQFDDVPVSVSINEAVELAKKYAPETDARFVNGLLSSVAKKLKAQAEENA